MFSIIVCSIRPAEAERLRQNVADTIGVPHEVIVFDNRDTGRGICSVYNQCARRAQYDALCFVHEDVKFTEPGWGALLAAKLAEPRCGVVGFAGGTMKLRNITGWHLDEGDKRVSYLQTDSRGRIVRHSKNPDGGDYTRVVALDGFFLACRRDVWAVSPFDEQTLRGFHAYDLDFTIAAACRYENYVCNLISPTHYSAGSYSRQWVEGLEACHAKWRDRLPMFAGEAPPPRRIEALEVRAEALWLRKLMREGLISRGEALRGVLALAGRAPLSAEPWKLMWKYVRWCTIGLNK